MIFCLLKKPFSIFWKANLVVIDSLRFCLVMSSSFLKGSFTGYNIGYMFLFPFCSLNVIPLPLGLEGFWCESGGSLMGIPL